MSWYQANARRASRVDPVVAQAASLPKPWEIHVEVLNGAGARYANEALSVNVGEPFRLGLDRVRGALDPVGSEPHDGVAERPDPDAEERVVAVVDDDISVREAVPDLLQEVGFAVQTFASAEAFLAADVADATDCLVLDVGLPGLSGPDLQQGARQAR